VAVALDDPFAVITNNKPGFRYKYPQAAPTPPNEDDVVWNKVYTAADSRMYNKHHKNANESRRYRESGETRILALRMLAENKQKHSLAVATAAASGLPLSSTPKASTPSMAKKKDPTVKKEPSSSSRDGTPGGDAIPMSISEKIKSEGRARKAPPAAPSSNQGTPAPSTAPKQGTPSASTKQSTPSSGPKLNSPAPDKASSAPPPKMPKPAKKGTATTVKKQHAKKQKSDGTPNYCKLWSSAVLTLLQQRRPAHRAQAAPANHLVQRMQRPLILKATTVENIVYVVVLMIIG
jgi:COMPASS component SPP1